MEFIFETIYDKKALTAMARAVRKTARKKRNKRSRIFGWIIIVFGNNHAQVYDKKHMTEGTTESFKTFITEKTGKMIEVI